MEAREMPVKAGVERPERLHAVDHALIAGLPHGTVVDDRSLHRPHRPARIDEAVPLRIALCGEAPRMLGDQTRLGLPVADLVLLVAAEGRAAVLREKGGR